MAKLLLVGILCLLTGCQAVPPVTPNQFQNYLNQWRQQNAVMSVIIQIENVNNGRTVSYISGTATLDKNARITQQTLYGIGSISKIFVAVTLLELQKEGKLNLDDPIGNYFPQYPRWKAVTIRQLLNMTSGIPNYTATHTFKKLEAKMHTKPIAPSRLLSLAYQQKDYFAPGKSWHYSNTNYILAALIIEKVTHQALATEYQQRFFHPLHLKHSHYSETYYPPPVERQMAHAYRNGNDITHFNAGLYDGAGAMVMSSQDLLSWCTALFASYKVLDHESLKALMSTTALPPALPKPFESHYGLGVYSMRSLKFGTIWWYTGIIRGYTSAFLWVPAKQTIITAQAATFAAHHSTILFPNRPLLQKALAEIYLVS